MLNDMLQMPLVDLPVPMPSKSVHSEPSTLASFLLGFVKRGLAVDGADIAILLGGGVPGNCDHDAGSFSLIHLLVGLARARLTSSVG